MKEYLLRVMQQGKKGLYLCELPTGNGKTYNAAQAMREYADSITDNKKIIYLTTMNKNLPEEELLKAYGNKEVYDQNVLRIRSNFDEVVDKINVIEVPENMQSDAYHSLCKDVILYRKAVKNSYADKEYIKELIKRINTNEKQFRYEIRRRLCKEFANKKERKKAIRTNDRYKWIAQIYPAVFTDEYKILLMSVSKFMKRNSILIDSSYEFLNSDLIKGAIIIIDEFDATKDTIKSELIERSLAMQEDYIQLFRKIHRVLRVDDFSIDIQKAARNIERDGTKYTINILLNEAREIAEKYHTRLSIKTKEALIDQKQVFLFNDGSFHTVLRGGEKYIRSTLNEEDNRIDIFFEGKKEFFENRDKEKDIIIYSMLRDISIFLSHFHIFVMEWAHNYMKIVNERRKDNSDEMSLENAISTVLKRLELTTRQRELLMGETCQTAKKSKGVMLPERRFYDVGMEYYEFEDNDSHHDYTNLKFVKIYDTPEKIMCYLAENATVFGISASAEIDTVVGNYNLCYLNERLRERYNSTPSDLKKKIENNLKSRWLPYSEGKVKIHSEIIPNKITSFNTEEYCKQFLNEEMARYAANIINNAIDDEYYVMRYCNILRAMHTFCVSQDIFSMLYLGMALPKMNHPEMDELVLKQLFEYTCIEADIELNKEKAFFVLRGDNFDSDKDDLLQRLGQGEKIFVMSSYQTIGAGQNLQYKVPDNFKNMVQLGVFDKNDKRFVYKDFDALYLGNITHMTVNTYSGEKIQATDLLQMLFQIEEVYENGEINYCEKDQLLKLAFRSYSGGVHFTHNTLYELRSVVNQASRMVLQAVGRLCRTFVKNSNIYFFIEEELLEKLNVGELKKRILPPEMQAIVALREKLGKEYTPKENILLNNAERISSVGFWTIRKMLSQNWTQDSMALWEQLRTLVLRYPTANIGEWENNEYIRKLYITSGNEQNQYIFSQYSDFSDVTIDFGNDKIAFKNSKRAKLKGESEEVAVYEMSEEESGLPLVLRYPGMKEYFNENGYALSFAANKYLMSPVLFHNIYKGALGEVAGKFILQRELGIELKTISEPEQFEFFDYMLSKDVYVDFKNWKMSYVQDKNEIRAEILRKANALGAKRVYIINVVCDKEYVPSSSVDQRLVEIPMLLNEDGSVNYTCLHKIQKEDFE